MPQTVLLVGTRKGCFVLDSDGDRRDWNVRGPFCEDWPIYHAVHDAESGTIYAAAASEWHGAGVWRSGDLGETWELSSEGISYGDNGARLSKISGLTAAHGRVLAGVETAGIFESRDGGATWSLLSTLEGQPGREDWNDPAKQPPGHLGLPAILPHPDEASRFWAVVQGIGIFETTDDGASFTPRNRGLRADWPLENPEVGYCVHKLVMSPVDHDRLYQQNHVGMHRSDDGAQSWVEITDGLPTEFGFAAAAHPHDRDTFYVIPLDPGHGRCMPEGEAAVWRTRDAGSTWQRLDRGLPQRDAHYAGVVEREVLAKGGRALLIAGDGHLLRGLTADHYPKLLGHVPSGVNFATRPTGNSKFVHLFVKEHGALVKQLQSLRQKIADDAAVWVSWPKKSSGVPTNITEDVIRAVALPLGFVDIKVCAVDDVWSGLKLMIRRENRKSNK